MFFQTHSSTVELQPQKVSARWLVLEKRSVNSAKSYFLDFGTILPISCLTDIRFQGKKIQFFVKGYVTHMPSFKLLRSPSHDLRTKRKRIGGELA